MEEKKINKRIVFSVVAVLLLIAVVAGATYAYFSATKSSAVQTVTTATMDLAFDDSTAIVNAANITPMYQSEIETKAAKKSFTVTNNGTQPMYLQMKLTEVNLDPELKDLWFRWALYEEGTRIGLGTFYQAGTEVFMQQNMVLEPGTANAKDYDLYIWIEDSDEEQNDLQGKTFSAKVTVNGSIAEYEKIKVVTETDYNGSTHSDDYLYYHTNVSSINFSPDNSNVFSYDMTKLTNLKSFSHSYPFLTVKNNYFPVSLTSLYFEGLSNLDLAYLTNLTSITGDFYGTISLPRSLTTYQLSCNGCEENHTYDFSNLVNLTSASGSGYTSTMTIILPKSIQNTASIDLGDATIVYQ